MSIRKRSLFEAILARISFGSVPVDGTYWFDPKGQAKSSTQAGSTQASVPDSGWSLISLSLPRRLNPEPRKSAVGESS
jgi:hypothetical protein